MRLEGEGGDDSALMFEPMLNGHKPPELWDKIVCPAPFAGSEGFGWMRHTALAHTAKEASSLIICHAGPLDLVNLI